MNEVWEEIPGYPNYHVSNLGYVANIKYGREVAPRSNGNGYYKVTLHNRGENCEAYIHRLVAEAFLPGFNHGVHISHRNDDKSDNSIGNLRIRRTKISGPLSADELNDPERGMVRVVETGDVFISVRACALYIGGDYGAIYAVLRGDRRTHLGLTYEFLEG